MPATRDSDVTLMIEVWKKFYSEYLVIREKDGEAFIKLKHLYIVPREDTIKRMRAKLNEEGKYLTSDEKVAKQRRLNMDEWHKAMAFNDYK
jgi:hypothetical protein